MTIVAALIVIDIVLALVAGSIAYSRLDSTSAFVGYFLIGALIPLLGIVAAALAQAPPKPPGWYDDPWHQAALRWYDGQHWTPHLG